MRIVTHRGKVKILNTWIAGILLPKSKQIVFEMEYNGKVDLSFFDVDESTIDVYTGFDDVCCYPLYENDIVRMYLSDGNTDGVVIWSKEHARFEFVPEDADRCTLAIDNTCKFEIIGNKHDNPTLFNAKYKSVGTPAKSKKDGEQ